MASREKKSTARDPLDNPYIADKFEKLQCVHTKMESLMDRLYSKNLKAEGRKPTRVPIKARKPGPRTEVEKRKYYRTRRPRPKVIPQPEALTLFEAAKHLGFESEKSILRLIKAGKLIARKDVSDKKRRWLIDSVDLNRYQMISSEFKRLVERVPILDGRKNKWRSSVKCYPAWGEQNLRDLPQHRLKVSIDDFWRFACQTVGSEKEYEAIRCEIRIRLPGRPRDFAVRFEFDPKEVDHTLMSIVKSVRPPKLAGEEWSKGQILSLQYAAFEHLKRTALPSLWAAKHGWKSYLGKSVKNFYIDLIRKHNRREILLNDLTDRDVLSELAHREWEEDSHN